MATTRIVEVVCSHFGDEGDEVIRLIASGCTELESGGRRIGAILTNTVLPAIRREFLVRIMEGKTIERVHVKVAKEKDRHDLA